MTTTRCIISDDRRPEVERFVQSLPAILSGQTRDPFGVVPAMHARIGYTFLSLVKTAYEIKGRGGVDEAGDSWAPLSAKYLAYKRPVKGRQPPRAGKLAPGRIRGGKNDGKIPDGYMTKGEREQWNRIYGGTLKRLIARLPIDEAKRIAAGRAWNVMKSLGVKTKLGTFGTRVVGQDYQTLVDTGALRRSLQPGTVQDGPTGTYQPKNGDQVYESTPRRVVIGTRIKYAAYHHYGKGTRRRRLWPEQFPSSWWRQILGQVRQGMLRYGDLFGGRTV